MCVCPNLASNPSLKVVPFAFYYVTLILILELDCYVQVRKILSESAPLKCAFSNCLHLGEPGCLVRENWERYPFYFQLLDEIKIREEFQLRTLGTKREGDVRYVY